jgi:hypothetical protein
MKTRKFLFFLMLGIMLGFLSGCDFLDDDDDGYSLQDVWAGFGLIQKDSASDSFTIELDNGAILVPSNASYWENDVHDNQRVLANFTILEDHQNADSTKQYNVKINSLRNILYKGILDITPAIEDSIGNDPIYVRDHWQTKNMLNFELQYLGGSKIHYINLVKQPNASATDPVVLELRHNNNDDLDRINMSAVVTFDLSSLKVTGKDSVNFKVVAKGFNNETFEYTGVYKY